MSDTPDRPSDLSAKVGPSDRPVRLSALWRRGQAPDLRAFLAGSGPLRPTGKKKGPTDAQGVSPFCGSSPGTCPGLRAGHLPGAALRGPGSLLRRRRRIAGLGFNRALTARHLPAVGQRGRAGHVTGTRVP
jgi:hypothetical protein